MTLSLMTLGALLGLPLVRVAPNRLVSGDAVSFFTLLHGAAWALPALLIVLLLLSLAPPRRICLWLTVATATALTVGLGALAASHATHVVQADAPFARTALGSGLWLVWLLLGLVLADTLQALRAGTLTRLVVATAVLLPLALLLASGSADDLSIMKEYANRREEYWGAMVRHCQIVALAMLFTLVIGLPLGWASHRFGRTGKAMFPLLNIIQTIPSIALFGLLMAPLAWLAASWPALGRVGISGVGLAPGVLALMLYSLLPVVRGTLAGLAQVPSAVTQAALGLGFSPAQLFWQAQVPLALPVVLSGVRTASIQAVGLAAVTALIGAGGLGSLMFEGLFSSAQDLVLLGVVPIVLLGVLVDGMFKLLIALTRSATPMELAQ
ncbi:TPA: ABC transporter permease [Pseudomonas aeruginosa]|jgi:osmoprotectant transport system permease protein|uniref:ABC transporter permease n=1 Tax=Pseudomonas aeruginosa TaxID=287 RepID=UPI0009360B93|nr:ABC transporter permease [Pseudomonas aeruginosa]MBI8982106.1 ABC transporter permease [Pseudomonas aeruginosa]MCS7816566.1 ABC transporter permease [Pseudomonas aeruginosa]MCS7852926.1 ABC transporter permease [Pseudomonas aeruginosa]MCS8253185.1 ABC transporter permease [Pseudomonas aeruginosa]MCS8259602.1 ABC transporter permease [Pseudomonas aeruginosa]|tara:strand:+ start:1179 stop:2324 length:1146 start_codon:yes stop_codon:yes gene_type:complete